MEGVVSSKLLYPDGTVQHAGVVFNKNLQVYHFTGGFIQTIMLLIE